MKIGDKHAMISVYLLLDYIVQHRSAKSSEATGTRVETVREMGLSVSSNLES